MTKDISNLDTCRRALQDVRFRIEELERILNSMNPIDTFEQDAYDAFTNSLGRLYNIRTCLMREKERLEESV